MPKVVTAGARPGRLRAGSPDEREGDSLRSREVRRAESDADASASATAEQRIIPSERLGSSNAGTARELGPSQNSVAISPEPVDPESVRQRNAFQTGSRELARFLRQNGEAFAQAQGAVEGDAAGFAQAWMEDYDRRAGEVFNRIPSEVRALFGNDFEALRAESFAEADSFERDRRILAIQQGIGGTRDDYVELVGQEPARLDYAFQKMEEMIRASGLRPDLIEEEVLAARRAIFTSYRQARLAGPNPEALLREMEAGRFEGIVPPEEMEALVVQTAAEVGQRQRAALMERQVDADTRQRLELQRLRAGEGADPHITPDALREIFPGEVGERKARQLEFERRRAEVRARTALMTPAEIEAAFGVFESESGTRGEAPDQTLAAGQGDETLAGGTESDRLEGSEGADTLSGEASDVEPDADRQEGQESIAAGQNANLEKGPEELGVEDNRESFKKDPAGHVLKYSDTCREATQAAEQATDYGEQVRLNEKAIDLCMAEQESIRGTSEGSRALSDEKIETTLAELDALPMLQRVERLWNFAVSRGRHAGRVLDELIQAGVPDAMGVAAHLWITGRTVEAEALRQALAKPENEHRRNMLGTEASQISDGVRRESEELRAAFGENGLNREGDARLKAAELIAWQLFQDGKGNVDEVIAMALAAVFPFQRMGGDDVVLLPVEPENGLRSKLDPDKVSNFLIWIRRSVWAGDVDASQAGLRNDMPFHLDEEQLAEQYTNNIRGHGYWRNTCDGVQLLDQLGRPVVRKDGSFLTVTWAEIEAWEGGGDRVRAAVTGESL